MSTIVNHLVLEDGIRASKQGVRQFLKRYGNRGTIARKPGSGFPGKLLPSVQQIIELAMRQDDDMTATQLQFKLAAYRLYVSLTTILRNRHQLGWVYRGSAYCQPYMSGKQAKAAGLGAHLPTYSFDDGIRSDKTTVQL